MPTSLSNDGDLVAKVTAIADWKRVFHARGTPVNDFAALLSDATVFQFMARPVRDLEGVRLLATALTVLSSRDCVPEVEALLRTDPRLAGCFTD